MIDSIIRANDFLAPASQLAKNWSAATAIPLVDFTPVDIAYGNGAFVLCHPTDRRFRYSHDGGKTWLASTVPGSSTVTARSIAYNNGRFLCALFRSANSSTVIWASDDLGVSWQEIAVWAGNTITNLAALGATAFVGTSSNAFRISTDGGVTWSVETPTMTTPSLAVVDGYVCCGHTSGMQVRNPSGVWTNYPISGSMLRTAKRIGKSSLFVYPYTAAKQFAISEDYGATWAPVTMVTTPVPNTSGASGGGIVVTGSGNNGLNFRYEADGSWSTFGTPGTGPFEYGMGRFITVYSTSGVSFSYGSQSVE